MVDNWRDFTPVHMDNASETLKDIQCKDCLMNLPNYWHLSDHSFLYHIIGRPPIVGVQGRENCSCWPFCTAFLGWLHIHHTLQNCQSLNYDIPVSPSMLYKFNFNLGIKGFYWFFSITLTVLHYAAEKSLGTRLFIIWLNSWRRVLEVKLTKKTTIHSGNFHTEKRLGTSHFEVALDCFGNDITSCGGLLIGCIGNWVGQFVPENNPVVQFDTTSTNFPAELLITGSMVFWVVPWT